MDIDKATEKLGKVDGFLTQWGVLWKKHWGKIIIIAIGGFIYWVDSLPEVEETPVEAVDAYHQQIEDVEGYYDENGEYQYYEVSQ